MSFVLHTYLGTLRPAVQYLQTTLDRLSTVFDDELRRGRKEACAFGCHRSFGLKKLFILSLSLSLSPRQDNPPVQMGTFGILTPEPIPDTQMHIILLNAIPMSQASRHRIHIHHPLSVGQDGSDKVWS